MCINTKIRQRIACFIAAGAVMVFTGCDKAPDRDTKSKGANAKRDCNAEVDECLEGCQGEGGAGPGCKTGCNKAFEECQKGK
jgi:hypothetical protein